VVLGAELATRLGVDVGDAADVIFAQPTFSSANSNRRLVRVAGFSARVYSNTTQPDLCLA